MKLSTGFEISPQREFSKVQGLSVEERNRLIAEQLNQGVSLGEIQKLLEQEHGVKMTYMELRLLASELENVDWSRQPETSFKVKPMDSETGAAADPGGGRTKVTVSQLARPGAAMSGSVDFASGAKAEWFLGNDGRLGLQPESGSEKPTEEDIREFQEELQKVVYGDGAAGGGL